MISHDPIVDEVRQAREAYAARFNYDLQAIYLDLKEQERRSGRKFISYARRDGGAVRPPGEQAHAEPKEPLQPAGPT
jgi:hypothetical protein